MKSKFIFLTFFIVMSFVITMKSQDNSVQKYFVVILTRGENWKDGKTVLQQDIAEHGTYMKKLYDEKSLIMAGPYTDNEGAVIILKVDSKETANTIVMNDPAVINKTFKADLHEWQVFFNADKK